LKVAWVQPDIRDEVIDYVRYYSDKTEIAAGNFIRRIGIARSKYYDWKHRYGKVNEHNAWIPRDFWLTDFERQAIIDYYYDNPLEGYRRLCYMMIDANIVAVSPSSVYRVLSNAGLLNKFNGKKSKKGTGFVQPLEPHKHWHIDISYINICGTFYYMCSVLDGFSRYIVHWEIREAMKESDVEIILQRAREKFPDAKPRIISDNGPQFISKDFKEFIRISGMTHVKTSPYYPQSNGKLERYHRTNKSTCIRAKTPLSMLDAQRLATDFVDRYNKQLQASDKLYTTSRSREGPQMFLRDYQQGYLQADAYAGYDFIFDDRVRNVKELLCWAHARRKFYDARKHAPQLSHTAITWIKLLYDVEKQIKELSADQKQAERQKKSVPILNDFKQWLDEITPEQALPQSRIRQAINYAINGWEALCRYTEDGDFSIDNNVAERLMRPIAVGRRNWLFFGSDRGGRTAAILSSIAQSASRHNLNVYTYLRDVIDRISDHPANQLHQLLPDNWTTR